MEILILIFSKMFRLENSIFTRASCCHRGKWSWELPLFFLRSWWSYYCLNLHFIYLSYWGIKWKTLVQNIRQTYSNTLKILVRNLLLTKYFDNSTMESIVLYRCDVSYNHLYFHKAYTNVEWYIVWKRYSCAREQVHIHCFLLQDCAWWLSHPKTRSLGDCSSVFRCV